MQWLTGFKDFGSSKGADVLEDNIRKFVGGKNQSENLTIDLNSCIKNLNELNRNLKGFFLLILLLTCNFRVKVSSASPPRKGHN